MTKRIKKINFAIISIIMALLCGVFYCLTNYQPNAIAQAPTRNIEVSTGKIDYQSVFDDFEDSKLETNNSITTFEGTKTFNLLDFEELDLVSLEEGGEAEFKVKYNYFYDSENNYITLTATLVGEDGLDIIDTMVGVPFVDENGNLDAVFDCDGESVLLSELQEAGMIENCGWFKKACKKVSKAVKKVTSTTIGQIGAVITVAAPLAFALTFSAVMPVGAVIFVGALAGAGISAGTAALSTYVQDGKVDWETVGICSGVGAAVGALSATAGYLINKSYANNTSNETTNNTASNETKSFDTYEQFRNEYGSANNSSVKYGTTGSKGTYEWHHIVEQNQIGNNGITAKNVYNTHNTISLGYDTHRKISGIYSTNIENLYKHNIEGLKQLFDGAKEGQTVRNYLSNLPFKEQYDMGIKILRLLGVNI